MLTLALAISCHIGDYTYDFNAIHPHVRYTTESNLIAGAYYNSEYNLSMYAGKRFEYNDEWGFEVGAVSGYYEAVIPFLRITYDDFYVAPTLYDKSEIGLVIGYEIELK